MTSGGNNFNDFPEIVPIREITTKTRKTFLFIVRGRGPISWVVPTEGSEHFSTHYMPSVASEQQWKISLGNEHTGRKRLYMHLPSKIIHGFGISGIPTSQQVNIMQQTAVLKLRNYSFYNYQYVLCWHHVYLLDKSQFSCTKQIKDLYFQQHTTHTHARMHTRLTALCLVKSSGF